MRLLVFVVLLALLSAACDYSELHPVDVAPACDCSSGFGLYCSDDNDQLRNVTCNVVRWGSVPVVACNVSGAETITLTCSDATARCRDDLCCPEPK